MRLTDGLKRVKVLQYVLDRPIAFELSDETEVIVGLEFHLYLKDGSVYSPFRPIYIEPMHSARSNMSSAGGGVNETIRGGGYV